MLTETYCVNLPRSIVTDHYLLDQAYGCIHIDPRDLWVCLALLMMMYDLEKASKSAPGISLYVSDDPKGSNEVLGPVAPKFPDQDGVAGI